MDTALREISEQQKASWDKFSTGWRKWDETAMLFTKPMAEKMIGFLQPEGSQQVLDIASGTGEPGLTIAAMLNGGKVVSVDISDGMLQVARDKAQKAGIKNFETVVADVTQLPFPDNSFDAVVCRFGFMFFPDMEMAAREMIRVLRPGGKLSVAVWGPPEKNFWVTAVMSVMQKELDLPSPPPGAPGMFRGAKQGTIGELLKNAGLQNIRELEVESVMPIESAGVYWEMMTEVAAPVASALDNADNTAREKIKNQVFENMHNRFPEGKIRLTSSAWIINGVK